MIAVYLEAGTGAQAGTLPKSSLSAIKAALEAKAAHGLGKAVGILIGGADAEKVASAAAGYGLDEVVYISDASLEQYLAVPYQTVLAQAAKDLGATLVVACSTSRAKDLMPRVAQTLGAGQASDVTAFLPGGHFQRLMYAGNVVAEVEILSPVKVATTRQTAFDAAAPAGSACGVRALAITAPAGGGQEFVSFDTVASERPELTDAETIVSGGRALKSAENFDKYIAPLADVLGAAIGASRAAVDSGYAPNDWQVGQTGKVVAPKLYVAVGISGAIQHLAGMKDSKCIVAINTDGEAPIFEIADYGLVADLYTAVPELIEELKKLKH